MELIPAIDLRGGRCVRLYQGDFAAETVYSNDPDEVLQRYVALGAARVHVVDLDGARAGQQQNVAIIGRLASGSGVSLQVGGGLRTRECVEQMLASGVERVVIGSLAVSEPPTVIEWMRRLGPHRFVLAFDVRIGPDRTPLLTTHGWQERTQHSLWDAAQEYLDAGVEHILCTDVERDGALTGPNLDLYREAVQRHPAIGWQASGGVSTGNDLVQLADCGVAAVISGRALLENRIDPKELEPFLPNASSPA